MMMKYFREHDCASRHPPRANPDSMSAPVQGCRPQRVGRPGPPIPLMKRDWLITNHPERADLAIVSRHRRGGWREYTVMKLSPHKPNPVQRLKAVWASVIHRLTIR